MSKITREALLHIPRSNYCYGYDENTLHIRLRAKKGEVKSAFLRIGDQYIWDELEGGGGNLGSGGKVWISSCDIKMEKELETEYFDYFIAKYNPPTKRSRYCFIIDGIDEKLLYTEKYIINLGNEDDQKKLNDISSFFAYSYLNKIDVLKIPSWVKDTVWYQIFPDRFANGDESINPKDTKTWGTPPTNDNFMGGDLQGVIDHLDYLKDLGVTGLYFCPITMGHTNHRYDTIDYMKIDPHLGDKKTLKKLVKEAHKRGMKIMLDAVFNHIGYYSKQWQDVIKNKEKSKYKDWFYIKDINKVDTPLNKIDSKNIPYETFSCVAEMPKLNTENEEVIEYLLEVGRYFIKEFDIDAWRLDVSNEVDHSFWRQFRKEVKKIKSDVYILGEIWHNSLPWLMGDQFDAVMNYPFADALIKFFCTNEIDEIEFKYRLNDIVSNYQMQTIESGFNLLGSHDTTRVLSYCNNNKDKFKLAYLFMFTQSGAPCIYYGDEVGMTGVQTKDCEGQRECMVWDEDKQDKEILTFMKKIISLRKRYSEFKLVNNEWVLAEDKVIIVKKENISIIINNNDFEKTIDLPDYLKDKKVYDLFNEVHVNLESKLTLNPYKYLIIKN